MPKIYIFTIKLHLIFTLTQNMSASVVIFVYKRGLLACVLNMRTICMVFVANGWFDTGFYDHVGHKPMITHYVATYK